MINTVRKLMTIGCFLMTLVSYSQEILWEKSFGGTHADYLFDAQPTADYGFILAGSSLSKKTGNKTAENNGDFDYLVWKMDESGELDWQKTFGGTGTDLLQSIKVTSDGGFILAGTSESEKGMSKKDSCRGKEDFWIIKLNAAGNEEWQKTIGGSGQELLQSVFQTADGGYILGGTSSSNKSKKMQKGKPFYGKSENSFGNLDYWVVKLDTQGDIAWQRTIGGEYADILRSIEQTNDGGFILGGYSNSGTSGNKAERNYGNGDYWVVKLDKEGITEWEKNYGGDGDDQLYVVHQTYDGHYIIGGNSNSDSSGNKGKSNRSGSDFWVLKVEEKGNILWQETYDVGKADFLTSLVENEDHSLLIGGYAMTEIAGSKKDAEDVNDYVAIKMTEKGEEIWRRAVGSKGEDILRKVIETRDGGYLMAGTSNPQPLGTVDGNRRDNFGGIDTSGQIAGVAEMQSQADEQIKEASDKANELYKNQSEEVMKRAKDALGQDAESRVKLGLSGPAAVLGIGQSGGGSNVGATQKKLPISRDKKNNFGSSDFWIVKLKDKNKKKTPKQNVEAVPNPAMQYTNVIVGYDFSKGTATVYDLAGRQLQHFAITDRTVPIDLGGLPEGIYIVQIKTNVSNDSVKVIKGINNN